MVARVRTEWLEWCRIPVWKTKISRGKWLGAIAIAALLCSLGIFLCHHTCGTILPVMQTTIFAC